MNQLEAIFSSPEKSGELLTAARAELWSRSFRDFAQRAWEVIEPTTPWVSNWHLDCIADHLQAVSAGEIKDLVINIPPRCCKSSLCSVLWPAWCWTGKLEGYKHHGPGTKLLTASYALPLSIRDSIRTRRLLLSPWFQFHFGRIIINDMSLDREQMIGERIIIRDDQDTKAWYENSKGGFRYTTAVGSGTTGHGGDILLVDDAHDATLVLSGSERERAVTWWRETWMTRRNDPKTTPRVLIGQRLHEEDVPGVALAAKEFDALVLPMRYEVPQPKRNTSLPPAKRTTTTIYPDPRTHEGELLWPERLGEKEVHELEETLGEVGTAGQLQQRPIPRGGGIIKSEWFEVIEELPAQFARMREARGWDLAGTKPKPGSKGDNPDWSVGLKGREIIPLNSELPYYVITDMTRFREEPEETFNNVKTTATQDGRKCRVGLYQDPAQAGKFQAVVFVKSMAGFSVEILPTTRGLHELLLPILPQAKVHNIKLLKGWWNDQFLREVGAFPAAAKDDIVAALCALFFVLLSPIEVTLDYATLNRD